MADEDRWERVRAIVREECERIEARILATLEKHGHKQKVEFVNGKWVGITPAQLEAWQAAYGAVDVEAELRKAAAWLVSNPQQNPKNQFGRFINSWLSRGQNQASIRAIPTRNEMQKKPRICAYCGAPSTGMTNGYEHCREHSQAAMEDRRPMQAVK